jgi:hypothetical protein
MRGQFAMPNPVDVPMMFGRERSRNGHIRYKEEPSTTKPLMDRRTSRKKSISPLSKTSGRESPLFHFPIVTPNRLIAEKMGLSQ